MEAECDVDDDSILAPFSQKDEKTEVILSQKTVKPFSTQTNGSTPTNPTTTDQHYLDEDDDLMNEFSKNLDDLLPLELYVPLISRDVDNVVIENVLFSGCDCRYHKWMAAMMSHRNEIVQNFHR